MVTLSRELSLKIRNVLDDWLPPAVRDSPIVMVPLLYAVFGRKYREFADFKAGGFALTPEEFADAYRRTAGLDVQGETDLNDRCVDAVLAGIKGGSVLEVGCGRGFLARKLVEVADQVTACDIVLASGSTGSERLQFLEASAEGLPFADNFFDVVVCTHTLEHVQRLDIALAELRRVARQRVIIVVPKERPYRFSFNLHLHFFPHAWSWQAVAGVVEGAVLIDLGDWFYVEPVASTVTVVQGARALS